MDGRRLNLVLSAPQQSAVHICRLENMPSLVFLPMDKNYQDGKNDSLVSACIGQIEAELVLVRKTPPRKLKNI